AAEEMVLGESSGGASDDLARVGDIARKMVCDFGMSERVRALPPSPGSQSSWRLVSDDTARLIDSEVDRMVEEAENLTHAALSASRDALDRVAVALLERETLTLEELDTLAGPPPSLPGHNGTGGRGAAPAAQVGPTSYG
ncbi:MAG: hypothetical protein M3400_12395, partial [Actinomycetota bacterium]|nr:hypothetical protein [Actinomycetota bacterium]